MSMINHFVVVSDAVKSMSCLCFTNSFSERLTFLSSTNLVSSKTYTRTDEMFWSLKRSRRSLLLGGRTGDSCPSLVPSYCPETYEASTSFLLSGRGMWVVVWVWSTRPLSRLGRYRSVELLCRPGLTGRFSVLPVRTYLRDLPSVGSRRVQNRVVQTRVLRRKGSSGPLDDGSPGVVSTECVRHLGGVWWRKTLRTAPKRN